MAWEYPNDDGGPVAHLDPAFRNGNAPRFHGMLKRLAETEGTGAMGGAPPDPIYVNVWAIDVLGPDDGEIRAGEVIQTGKYNEYSILAGSARHDPRPDLQVAEFFHHADILTGQDVGTVPDHADTIRSELKIVSGEWIEDALDRIEAARVCKPGQPADADGTTFGVWADLLAYFDIHSQLWQTSWNTDSGKVAQSRFEDLSRWYGDQDFEDHFRCWGLGRLAQCLAGFAAVIHGARLDIDNLMGACVEQVHAWNERQNPLPFSEGPLAWAALSEVATVAASGKIAIPTLTVNLLKGMTDSMAMNKTLPNEPQCYDILANYLREADAILDAAVDGVDALVRDMRSIRSSFPSVPAWD